MVYVDDVGHAGVKQVNEKMRCAAHLLLGTRPAGSLFPFIESGKGGAGLERALGHRRGCRLDRGLDDHRRRQLGGRGRLLEEILLFLCHDRVYRLLGT